MTSRTNFSVTFLPKSVISLSTLSKHHKSSTFSMLVENVHWIVHVQGQKRQGILSQTVRLSRLLFSFDCRALDIEQVNVMEMTFENHLVLNEAHGSEQTSISLTI